MSKKHAHGPNRSTHPTERHASGKGIDQRLIITMVVAVVVVGAIFVALRPSGTNAAAGAVQIPEQDGVQRISIEANGRFSPSELSAKAGVPIELTFGPGVGCSQAVKFPSLGIAEDIRAGNTVVKLPALKKGTYEMYCQSDMDMGTLHVQ